MIVIFSTLLEKDASWKITMGLLIIAFYLVGERRLMKNSKFVIFHVLILCVYLIRKRRFMENDKFVIIEEGA